MQLCLLIVHLEPTLIKYNIMFNIWLIIIIGLAAGSFLNVVEYRSAYGGPISKGRSICPRCKKVLKWYELVPVLSFVFQTGKCRKCKEKISWQYPLIELLTAGIFVLIWQFYLKNQIFQNRIMFIIFTALSFCLAANLIVIFLYDLKYLEIPMSFLIWGIVFSLAAVAVRDINWALSTNNVWQQGLLKVFLHSAFFSGMLGALAAGGFFFALVAISRERWMGQGDIYIGAIIGMFLGWPWILEALIMAFVFGALVGIILMVLKRKKLSAKIAFGPFLVFGYFVALLWGQQIFAWYANLLILNLKI